MGNQIKRKAQVVLCCKAPDLRVLLLRTNPKRGSFWQNITGGVEENEDFPTGALRELMEETGLNRENIIEFIDLDLEFNFHDQWNFDVSEKSYLALVETEFTPTLDPSEHDDYKWLSVDKISDSCYNYKSNYEVFLKAKTLVKT